MTDIRIVHRSECQIEPAIHLLKRGERESQKIIAKWRCGNKEKRNGFWKTEEEKKCRICGVEEGCIEHIMSHTRIKIGLSEVLDEREKEEVVKWMKKVKRLKEVYRREIERVRKCECN